MLLTVDLIFFTAANVKCLWALSLMLKALLFSHLSAIAIESSIPRLRSLLASSYREAAFPIHCSCVASGLFSIIVNKDIADEYSRFLCSRARLFTIWVLYSFNLLTSTSSPKRTAFLKLLWSAIGTLQFASSFSLCTFNSAHNRPT